jgi:beta-lactamase regulating signal transducer with metallopeptidase domain
MSAVELAVALSLLAVLVPNLLPLHRAAPVTGAVVWMLALLLRALIVVSVATFAFTQLANANVVESALGWCWHEVLPDIPTLLGFAEQPVAHGAVAVPAMVLAVALIVHTLGLLRAWAGLRRRLDAGVRKAPVGTAVIADDEVVFAVTRLGRARVLVSDRTLEVMDEDELAAGLAHEVAHIRRRHRPVLLVASLLATLARPLPGTRAAERELRFQLERDADACAVSRLHDPLSLASAICKAAAGNEPSAAASLAGRGAVTPRLAELLDGRGVRSSRVEIGGRALAAGLAALVLALALAAPTWALHPRGGDRAGDGHVCSHH